MRNRTAVWRVSEPPPELPPAADSGRVVPSRAPNASSPFWTTAAILAVHVPLALAMDRIGWLTTAHALLTFSVGLWMALSRRVDRVMLVIGYITGAEILWRMTSASVNWEFGKYAAAAIMLVAIFRSGRLKPPILPVMYFALLLPSASLTLANETWAVARDQISFNLSGPLALAVAGWFFSRMEISRKDLQALFIGVIAPTIGVVALAARGTFSASDILFIDQSNLITSGGFGPNQVSGALGLGVLLALFLMLDDRLSRTVRLLFGAATVAFAAQSALTFSRGGLYIATGGAAVAACFAARDVRLRAKLVPILLVFLVIGNYFVLPYLDAFTGGKISARFEDTYSTGRDRMIRADIDLWKDNVLFGVGPGEGRMQRGLYFQGDASGLVPLAAGYSMAAHTEFSRLLSEHGVFGLLALLIFVIAGITNVRRQPDARTRAIAAGLIAWSTLFMFSYATRALAPSFTFGLAFATFLSGEGTPEGLPAGGTAATQRRAGGWRQLVQDHPALRERGPSRDRA